MTDRMLEAAAQGERKDREPSHKESAKTNAAYNHITAAGRVQSMTRVALPIQAA